MWFFKAAHGREYVYIELTTYPSPFGGEDQEPLKTKAKINETRPIVAHQLYYSR